MALLLANRAGILFQTDAPPEPEPEPGLEGSSGGRADGGPPDSLSIAGLGRRHLAFLAGALVVVWILLVFSRAVSQSAAITDEATALRVANAQLEERLAAGREELALIRAESFIRMDSRAYAMGEPGERVFSLSAGAPPPPQIVPLGAAQSTPPAASPLDGWLDLLFGP
ncbi:MAG: hypothetical protein ACR2JZ_06065 [Candidatus Limnocylindrales bacterium]